MLVDTWNGSPRHVSTFFWCFFGYVSCCEHRLWSILETCYLKIQNGHISGKIVPPSGGSRESARRLPPRTPQHPYFQTPIGLKSKTALITKRWRKKWSQLLPEERIIDDARGWAGRLGVHSKNKLHLLRVGWLAMESVHLTCPCCSEDVVLRDVSGYWLNLSPKIANISQIRVEIQGPQLQELRHVSCFLVNGPQKSCKAFPRKSRKTLVQSGHVSWYLKR